MVWLEPLIATIVLMVVSVTIATIIGIPTAWACTVLRELGGRWRTGANLIVSMLTAVAFVPLVLHGAAWEATAGKFGWTMLTQAGTVSSSSGSYVFFSGLFATAWIHGVHGATVVTLATLFGVNRIPRSIVDQSRLDTGPIARWWKIRLQLAKPWWIIAMMAVSGIAATEMTIADLYGYRTLADQFYLQYALTPTTSAILWSTAVPLAVALMLIFHWAVSCREQVFASNNDTDSCFDFQTDHLHPSIVCWVLLIATTTVLLTAVVPIAGLVSNLGRVVIQSGDQLRADWSASMAAERAVAALNIFSSEYRWTAIIALVTSISSVTIAWPIASMGRRSQRLGHAVDLGSIALVCIPGPIVGLAVVSLFQTNVPGFRFLYQQTIVPTVISMLVRGVPVSYWIIRAGYRSIASETLELARMDAGPLRQFWLVERPLVIRSLIGGLLVSAVVTSGDLPVSLPVIPAGVTTVPVRLFGLLHSGARYQEASLVIWYVIAIVLVFAALRLVYTDKQD